MTTLPEALRLADALDAWDGTLMMPAGWRQRTSAELRRLHAENERIGPLAERVLELKAQRDALLAALRWIGNVNAMDYEYQAKARAAIKAVEEN